MPATGATSIRSLQARSAAARRWGTADRDTIARDYAAARLEDYIRKTVAAAPPLTEDQRDRLAALLSPNTSGGAA